MYNNTLLSRCASTAAPAVAPAILAALFLCSSVLAGGLDPDSPWPMFHRNAAHTARTFDSIPAQGVVKWSVMLSDTVEYSSPAIGSDGTIYLGDQGKELWAFSPGGAPLWNYHTEGNIRHSSPAIGDSGIVYIGSGDGNLYALRPDGSVRWAAPTGGAVKTAPVLAADGTIYVGSDDGFLWAFNPDGSEQWRFAAGDTIRSSPALDSQGNIYFGCNNGGIFALEPGGGEIWSGFTGGQVKAALAVGQGGDIIVASGDGFLYSIRPDGELNWAEFTDSNLRSSPAIGVTGKIYLGVDTEITAFRDEGNLTWSYETGDRIYSSPAVHVTPDSSEIVICGSDDGYLYAVSEGNLVWRVWIGAPIRSSPAIGEDGRIYVGAMNGRLYAIGAEASDVAEDERDDSDGSHRATGARWSLQVVPNPVKPGEETSIRLSGPLSGRAQGLLSIFDASGRNVFRASPSEGGRVLWNGRSSGGRALPAGVYFIHWSDGLSQAGQRIVMAP